MSFELNLLLLSVEGIKYPFWNLYILLVVIYPQKSGMHVRCSEAIRAHITLLSYFHRQYTIYAHVVTL